MEEAGHFYRIRYRLKGQLARHHWEQRKPFTPSQEDAWKLLNEFEEIIKLLVQLERRINPNEESEVAY